MYENAIMKQITLYANLRHLKMQLVPNNMKLLQKVSNCLKGHIVK